MGLPHRAVQCSAARDRRLRAFRTKPRQKPPPLQAQQKMQKTNHFSLDRLALYALAGGFLSWGWSVSAWERLGAAACGACGACARLQNPSAALTSSKRPPMQLLCGVGSLTSACRELPFAEREPLYRASGLTTVSESCATTMSCECAPLAARCGNGRK